jgi:hypothetical protein
MKAGDRRMWHMRGTNEPVEVEIVRAEPQKGWYVVQLVGKPTAHFAHLSELQPVKQVQPEADHAK